MIRAADAARSERSPVAQLCALERPVSRPQSPSAHSAMYFGADDEKGGA